MTMVGWRLGCGGVGGGATQKPDFGIHNFPFLQIILYIKIITAKITVYWSIFSFVTSRLEKKTTTLHFNKSVEANFRVCVLLFQPVY